MNFSQVGSQSRRRWSYLDPEILRRTLLKKFADVSTRNRNSDFDSGVAISEIILASAFRNDPD
jgi:hypothetical protein